VFVLDRYYPQSLKRTEGDQEQMQDKLPRESVESDVFLEWTQGYLFYKVHFDQALPVVFFH
jgi:hypothetical protein